MSDRGRYRAVSGTVWTAKRGKMGTQKKVSRKGIQCVGSLTAWPQ